MKVKFDLNQPNIISEKVSFKGYKPSKSEYGEREYKFNYVFDDSKKDCYLEIFRVDKDSNGNYRVTGEKDKFGNIKPIQNYNAIMNGEDGSSIKIESGTVINLTSDYGLSPNEGFAYHYVLRPKGQPDGVPEYKLDPGNTINNAASSQRMHEVYNFVSDKASTVSKGGAMKLIVPDNNNVLWVYDKDNKIVENPNIERARKTTKNIFNKIGGSLAGIEKDIDDGKLDNFTRIITTPLFADDSLAAHGYWNKNCFQMAQSLGNINNYTSLQKKMFAKGMNLVADGAYVNEGLEGVHFRHVLRWGKKSPYFNWFRISGLEDSPLSMGVFGKKLDHVTHRLINSKYKYEQRPDGSIKISGNHNYKSNQPTYIQIYDDRLVNAENLSEKELIKAYDKLVKNNLDINTHNDSVVPYSFRIDSETYKQNAILLSTYNKNNKKVDLYSGEGTRAVTQFEYFGFDGKHESGFETWDANPDIAKLNYVPSNNETQKLKNISDIVKRNELKKQLLQKNMEVQDYAVLSAKYWTMKTNKILNLHVAQHLTDIKGKSSDDITKIIKNLSKTVLPKDLDLNKEIVKNVIYGRYVLKGTDTENNYDKAILQGLMNTPLDSVEVGDDIVSVLASPLMTKRAISEEQIGKSRFEMYKQKNPHLLPQYKDTYEQTDKLYEKEMFTFAKDILDAINNALPKDGKLKDEQGNTTEYGKYVLPLLTAEIARFAVIKGVKPDAEFKYDKKTGEISYDYKSLKSTSLLRMNIVADSPEDEAFLLISKLKHNINYINTKDKEELIKALSQSIKGTSYESFALADMIVSRAEAGLDWRIDATKDIADIDSLKDEKTNFEYTWNKVIVFWSKFTEGVKEYHPDAYIAAEVTDEGTIYGRGKGYKSGSRYSNIKEVVKKLINEAGFTTVANYTYLSSAINQIFGKLFDYDGETSPDKGLFHGSTVYNQLIGGGNFFGSEPLSSLIYTYTFAGNHDKCRALEGYATDMDMVYTDLTDIKNYEYRNRAYKILHALPYGNEPNWDSVNCYDYSHVSNLAIAKCETISSGMGKAAYKIGLSDDKAKHIYGAMLDALKNLSNSRHKGREYEADGFGTKDYNTALDIVLDEMEYVGLNLSADEKKRLKDKTFEFIIDPAVSKYLGHIKFLVALNGNPTLYAGDDYGSTGFETTTKNIYLQNRNIIREDWADPKSPEYKEFIARAKNYIDYQFGLRARKELHPLNDGTPFMLDLQNAKYSKPVYESNFEDKVKGYENGNTQLSALLKQSPDGCMTISVFNTEGLNHKFDEYYRPAEITMNSINLNTSRGKFDKLTTVSGLRAGMYFLNADKNDKTRYYVDDNNQITGPDHKPIKFKDSTLILYHEPSFCGSKVLYNPQYNFVSKPYENKKQAETGSKLQLLVK